MTNRIAAISVFGSSRRNPQIRRLPFGMRQDQHTGQPLHRRQGKGALLLEFSPAALLAGRRLGVVVVGPSLWVPIIRSWALTRGFALRPGTRNRYEIRDTRTQHRPASRQVNDHGRVSGTHRLPPHHRRARRSRPADRSLHGVQNPQTAPLRPRRAAHERDLESVPALPGRRCLRLASIPVPKHTSVTK